MAQTPFYGARAPSYTAAQAERGKGLYEASCGTCHGADLNGGQFAPAVRGAAFQAKWGAQAPQALLTYIRDNMPPGGGLTGAAAADITAHIFQGNGVAPGSGEFAVAQAQPPRAQQAQAQPAQPQPAQAQPPQAQRAQAAPAAAPPPPERGGGFGAMSPNHDAAYEREMARKAALLAKLAPVTDATLAAPQDGDWLMWRRTYSSQGFSPLTQIDAGNVSTLRAAWSWGLRPSSNSITPLAYNGVLFVHSADTVQAFDAAKGDLLWSYVRRLPDSMNGGRGARSKGVAIHGDAIYAPTVDGHIVALDVKTGAVLWDKEILTDADLSRGVRLNGVPIVAKGKVIMGVSLSISLAGGCYIFALDTKTGEETWRFHTVARPGQPGGDSWNGVPVEQRFGGAIWTGGSYDPELNLVYFGVGNTYDSTTLLMNGGVDGPSPKNAGLYTESTVALNADTGRLAWHRQHMTRDVWDLDWAFEQTLIDMPVNGRMRKLLVTGGKLAIFDAIDRTNGRYVFSRDSGLQTVVKSIDPRTGEKIVDPALKPEAGVTKLLCPGSRGLRNWEATSYNPQTHVLIIPMAETCENFTWTPRDPSRAGGIDQRFQMRPMPDTDGNFGRLQAINLQTGETEWVERRRAPMSSSVLATAGGIAFHGARDRFFRAYDQADGKILWEARLDNAASSSPITYSVDGVQYVAVVTGGGNPQDTGWQPLTPEMTNPTGTTMLWVFKLP